jgi:hypothetical protein
MLFYPLPNMLFYPLLNMLFYPLPNMLFYPLPKILYKILETSFKLYFIDFFTNLLSFEGNSGS